MWRFIHVYLSSVAWGESKVAILVSNFNLLFLMVPGTACSVIGKTLIEELGGVWLPSSDILKGDRLVMSRKHHDLAELVHHGVLSEGERSNLLVFATVRNPYDRLVTHWKRMASDWYQGSLRVQRDNIDRMGSSLSANERSVRLRHLRRKMWIARRRSFLVRFAGFNFWIRRTINLFEKTDSEARDPALARRLRLYPFTGGVDHLIRYESLQAGLQQVLGKAGCDRTVEIPRRNVTPGKKPFTTYWSDSSVRIMERHYGPLLREYGYTHIGSDESMGSCLPGPGAESLSRSFGIRY